MASLLASGDAVDQALACLHALGGRTYLHFARGLLMVSDYRPPLAVVIVLSLSDKVL